MRCHIPLEELRALQAAGPPVGSDGRCFVKIRAAVLEATGGPSTSRSSSSPHRGPVEVLVRLGASGVCRSDYNAIDGTTSTPCPVVLGHEGAGVVEAIGAGRDAGRGRRPRGALVDTVVR